VHKSRILHTATFLVIEVGGIALLVDAKNEGVAGWYAGYGALPLLHAPLSLLLPLATSPNGLEGFWKALIFGYTPPL
jgi:hypothetical protein